jgi:aminoglycoside phosphotransferase (APT) family kinase protein
MTDGGGPGGPEGPEGPEVYRLARAHRTADARAAVERALGGRVARLRRSPVGASHAVYLATLADGLQGVARFATHPDHALARELWATERCRAAGVPAPRLLAADLAPEGGGPPFAVHARLPGRPGRRVALRPVERRAVLEELGRLAARIHSVRVPGVGALEARGDPRAGGGPLGDPAGDGYAGTSASWWEYARGALERRLADLPPGALPPELAAAVRRRFAEDRPALEAALPAGAPESGLVHGDFRLENTLLARDAAGRVHVSAVLDFEMVLAGDGAVDLAWLCYEDGRDEDDLAAILRGYGPPSGGPAADGGLRRRLLLYQVDYALGHLWWKVGFGDRAGAARVLTRLRDLVAAMEPPRGAPRTLP